MQESDVWNQIQLYIEKEINRPNYEMWFQKTKGYLKEERELIIEAENDFVRDWLESRYSGLIDEAIDHVKSEIDSYLIVSISGINNSIRSKRRLQENEVTEILQLLNELKRDIQELNDRNTIMMGMLEEIIEKNDI